MPWAPFDDGFHHNGKILALSDAAFRVYVCAITYSYEQRTGGYLTEAQARAVCGAQGKSMKAMAKELTKTPVGFDNPYWHELSEGRFYIHDFDKMPKTDAMRKAEARSHERHEKVRKMSGQNTDESPENVRTKSSGLVREGYVSPSPASKRKKEKPEPTPEARKLIAALWEIRTATGCSLPDKVPASWLRDADAILRIDKRPVDEAIAVLRWAQSGWWEGKILYLGALRAKYDTLRIAMRKEGQPANGHKHMTAAEMDAEAEAILALERLP